MPVSVTVLCPNGRRQNVKVNPNTRILQIIEIVCAKQGLNPAEYNVKFQRSILDVQHPIRFTNLPNNAKLEMVKLDHARTESPTQLALQLSSGERLQHCFAPSDSLWDVLTYWEGQPQSPHKGHLMASKTDVDGQILHPVCIYMRQEIIGDAALKSTSLHSLGLTGGKSLIRLIHRAADLPMPDTSIQAQQFEPKKVPTPSVTTVHSTTKSANHDVSDTSIAKQGESKSSQPRQNNNSMEVDVSSSTSSVSVDALLQANLAGEGTVAATTSVKPSQGHASPMEVDSCSSSEGLQSDVERATASKKMKARSNQQETPFSLTREDEQFGDQMGAALAQAIMQQRGAQPSVPAPSPFANFKFPESSVPRPNANNTKSPGADSVKPCDRMPIVYDTANDVPDDGTVTDVPEEFFEVTVQDVRKMYSDLKNQSARMGEGALETKSMREARERKEMKRYSKVVVRIHYPDRLVLQGFFRPQETVKAVTEFVKSHLEDSSEKFYLYTTPPKTVLKDQKQTLFTAKLCPAAIVHFGTSLEKGHHLSEWTLSQMETFIKADQLVAENIQTLHPRVHHSIASTSQTTNYDVAGPSTSNAGVVGGNLQVPADRYPQTNRRQTSSTGTSGQVPKWFKVGKK